MSSLIQTGDALVIVDVQNDFLPGCSLAVPHGADVIAPLYGMVVAFQVNEDGSLAKGEVFFDMTSAPGEEALDGLKVDQQGNLYVSGPGGTWILSAEGQHLGTIKPPRLAANFARRDEDGKTLYLTAPNALHKMPLNISGARPSTARPPINAKRNSRARGAPTR